MGKFQMGILGHVDGKVGTVIGSRWRGVDYVRAKGRRVTKPPTLKQQVQQAKFALMSKFLFSISRLLMESFNDPSEKMTGINRAMRYNIKNAIAGDYPSFSIDHSKVLLSQGILHNVYSPAVSAGGPGAIRITWTPNSGPNANADDHCIIVAYCPETNQAIYATTGAERSAGSDELDATLFTGKLVHTWVLFAAVESTAVSSSAYTGTITVS